MRKSFKPINGNDIILEFHFMEQYRYVQLYISESSKASWDASKSLDF